MAFELDYVELGSEEGLILMSDSLGPFWLLCWEVSTRASAEGETSQEAVARNQMRANSIWNNIENGVYLWVLEDVSKWGRPGGFVD